MYYIEWNGLGLDEQEERKSMRSGASMQKSLRGMLSWLGIDCIHIWRDEMTWKWTNRKEEK